jgi:predicted nucleic acid-binding protein
MSAWLDATFFVSLFNTKDKNHARAKRDLALLKRYERKTHLLALAEVTAVVGPALGGKTAEKVVRAIADDVEVVYPEKSDVDDAMSLVLKYDGKLSLSDALLLHYAARANDPLLSYDSDFDGKCIRLGERP